MLYVGKWTFYVGKLFYLQSDTLFTSVSCFHIANHIKILKIHTLTCVHAYSYSDTDRYTHAHFYLYHESEGQDFGLTTEMCNLWRAAAMRVGVPISYRLFWKVVSLGFGTGLNPTHQNIKHLMVVSERAFSGPTLEARPSLNGRQYLSIPPTSHPFPLEHCGDSKWNWGGDSQSCQFLFWWEDYHAHHPRSTQRRPPDGQQLRRGSSTEGLSGDAQRASLGPWQWEPTLGPRRGAWTSPPGQPQSTPPPAKSSQSRLSFTDQILNPCDMKAGVSLISGGLGLQWLEAGFRFPARDWVGSQQLDY